MGSKPRSQSCSSGLPACGGLGAHRPPTTRLSAQPFPKKGRKGRPSLATLREGTPSKGRRTISGSECQEGRVGEGSRQRLSTKVTESHVLCWPTIRVPREAGPCGLPTPILTFPHHQHSSLLSISSSRTSATANFTPAPHRMCPPPACPQGSPLLARRLLLLAGDRPWVTRQGEETQSLHVPQEQAAPAPGGPQSGWRPAGRQVHMCACSHAQVCAGWRTRSALPPPTQGVWATGQGCSRVTVFGPRRGRFLPGAQAQLAC